MGDGRGTRPQRHGPTTIAFNSMALKTIAHRVGSCKDNNSRMAEKTWAIHASSDPINSLSVDKTFDH